MNHDDELLIESAIKHLKDNEMPLMARAVEKLKDELTEASRLVEFWKKSSKEWSLSRARVLNSKKTENT